MLLNYFNPELLSKRGCQNCVTLYTCQARFFSTLLPGYYFITAEVQHYCRPLRSCKPDSFKQVIARAIVSLHFLANTQNLKQALICIVHTCEELRIILNSYESYTINTSIYYNVLLLILNIDCTQIHSR